MPSSNKASYLLLFQDKGPDNAVLEGFSLLDTSAYTGDMDMDKEGLKILADELEKLSDFHEGGIFMYTLHVAVNSRVVEMGGDAFLSPEKNLEAVIHMIVNIAKVALSHYAVYGCEDCPYQAGIRWSDLWDVERGWGVSNSWYVGLSGLAFSYDVLHKDMNTEQRRFLNSALALMVKGRRYWGISDTSDVFSPNVQKHPHRIYSNWAIYHANLYLANLVIEGETDFDEMTSEVGVGFDTVINDRVRDIYSAYIQHATYPDGSGFEDGYTFNLAFREGSLGFIALARRGENYLDSPRGRNMIHYVAQSYEPYRCGNFVGHSSGGGLLYHTFQVSTTISFLAFFLRLSISFPSDSTGA